ncbi:FAD-dependent oxidoreductase [Glycomyces tenuis]|uniref:FAD-dependent oxidoreductase n=1 Tax=Glycomyces tenuis TaxID=58116 RepID=UPI0004102099|nr:NAD(P)/FAD-dependent oxidoreductase [Glycomyces tenuis]
MRTREVVIIGGGAAGSSAASTLTRLCFDGRVRVIGENGTPPYNRTLVNKGLMTGLLTDEQMALPPAEGVDRLLDTVRGLDTARSYVSLDSGDKLRFDAAIIATGSRPRPLPDGLPGLGRALTTGRLVTLHSARDGRRVHDRLEAGTARITVLGAGLVGSETASLLHRAGHQVTLVARSQTPLVPTLGQVVAEHVAALHRDHVTALFGRTVAAFHHRSDVLDVHLDDGTVIESDLTITAHGTVPAPPGMGWATPGVEVDDRLRSTADTRLYVAGGVALFPMGARRFRIDHWDDAAAQGTHVARSLLHDLGDGDDPGPYRPRSRYSVNLYGTTVTGVGTAIPDGTERLVSREPAVTAFANADGEPTGAVGIDATREILAWSAQLHDANR